MKSSYIWVLRTAVIATMIGVALPAGAAQSSLQENAARRRAERMEERSTRRTVRPPSQPAPAASPQAQRLERRRSRIKDAVIDSTNAEREKAGLPPLRYNSLLEYSAQQYAADMQRRDFFSHETPEGGTLQERVQATGYGAITLETCGCDWFRVDFGENLAKGQQSVVQVMRDWMASPKHREAILSPQFQDIGIGLAGRYWVQHFGGITKE